MSFRFRCDHSIAGDASAIVDRALRAAGGDAADDDWDVLWTLAAPPVPHLRRAAAEGRRVAYIPGIEALTSKPRLGATFARAAHRWNALDLRAVPARYPATYHIPDDLDGFSFAAAYHPRMQFIRRPKVAGSNQRPELVTNHEAAKRDSRWIVQEYLADPHLLDGRKYTLRVAALISSLDPLTLDLWREPRVMRAGDASVVATTEPDAVSLESLTAALAADGLSWTAIWSTMALTAGGLVAAARDTMLETCADLAVPPAATFALIEFDFLLDRSGNVYLLECAPLPHVKPPAGDARPLETERWSHRLIAATLQRIGVSGAPHADAALSSFVPVFPSPRLEWLALVGTSRPRDVNAARAAQAAQAPGDGSPDDRVFAHHVSHWFLDDAIVLFSHTSEQLSVLNPTASYTWMRSVEGARPAAIARELADLFHGDPDVVDHDVWKTIAGWLGDGLLSRTEQPQSAAIDPPGLTPHRVRGWNAHERVYAYLGKHVRVRYPDKETARWLHPTLEPYETGVADACNAEIDVVSLRPGYELLINGSRRTGHHHAYDMPALLSVQLRRAALAERASVFSGRLTVVEGAGGAALVLDAPAAPDGFWTAVASSGLRVDRRPQVVLAGWPLQCFRATSIDTPLALTSLVRIERAIDDEGSSLQPCRRADALRQLLIDDPGPLTILDAAGAKRLVDFVGGLSCQRLRIADLAAATRLAEMLSA